MANQRPSLFAPAGHEVIVLSRMKAWQARVERDFGQFRVARGLMGDRKRWPGGVASNGRGGYNEDLEFTSRCGDEQNCC